MFMMKNVDMCWKEENQSKQVNTKEKQINPRRKSKIKIKK